MLLKYFFDFDYFYGAEYMCVRDYIKRHSIDDSVPLVVDRTRNDSIICKLDDIGVVVEVGFNDRNLKWTIYQVFKLIDEDTKFGNIVNLEPVLDEEAIMDVVKLIDFKARFVPISLDDKAAL